MMQKSGSNIKNLLLGTRQTTSRKDLVHYAKRFVTNGVRQMQNTGLSIKNLLLGIRQTTSKEDLVQYANRVMDQTGNHMTYHQAETINDMKLIGAKEFRGVVAFSTPRDGLSTKLELTLKAKRVPDHVIKAIVSEVASTPVYSDVFEDFGVGEDGDAHIFKATVMIKPCDQFENHSQVALAVSGASLNAAREVDYYNEERIPNHKEISKPKEVTESGILGDYKKIVWVPEIQYLEPTFKKTPVFKQKEFTPAKLESMKIFLEAKTLGEVRLLYGPERKEIK